MRRDRMPLDWLGLFDSVHVRDSEVLCLHRSDLEIVARDFIYSLNDMWNFAQSFLVSTSTISHMHIYQHIGQMVSLRVIIRLRCQDAHIYVYV